MPSSEHIDLSDRCLRWVATRSTARGIRGGREVYVARNYVADALCVGSLQHRHYRRYKPSPKSIADLSDAWGYWAFLFEVKVSRSDFLSTFGPSRKPLHENRHQPVASLHWVVTPAGLLSTGDRVVLPAWWGVLEQSGQGLREIRKALLRDVTQPLLDHLHYEILWNGSARSER